MQNIKEHIIFRILTIALVVAIVTPSLVKFAHVFENHKHEICLDNQQTHLHALDLDCEFYKFKVNKAFTFKTFDTELFSIENNYKIIHSQYHFISDYQRLAFSLRGPPQLI